jgi:hypothetical protein
MEELARKIARDLFVNGAGERADQLRLMQGDRYLGGRSEEAVAKIIFRHLVELNK